MMYHYKYYNILRIPEGKRGKWAIAHKVEPPGKIFHMATLRTRMHGQKPPDAPVTWSFETRWHQLLEDGGTWMQDIPIEQWQHRTAIAPMRGRVLVGGLGLGLAATLLARKRTVTHIGIIEKNQAVIDLVWPHLGKAVHRKAAIVHEDLFTYLRFQPQVRLWDWAFYDIWTPDGEATFHHFVYPLRKLSQIRVANVRCWNEDVMRGQLVANLINRMDMMLRPVQIRPAELSDDQIRMLLLHDNAIYNKWARPFWQRFYAINPDPADIRWRREAVKYALTYGMEFP